MNDTIYRKDAINALEKLSACKEYGVEVGTDEETYIGKYEAITAISDLPSTDRPPMSSISNNDVHLCMSCGYDYPNCPCENVLFGDGNGNDNICCCSSYDPLWTKEIMTIHITERSRQ